MWRDAQLSVSQEWRAIGPACQAAPEASSKLCEATLHRGLLHSLVDVGDGDDGSCPAHPVVHKLPVGAQPGALVRPASNRGGQKITCRHPRVLPLKHGSQAGALHGTAGGRAGGSVLLHQHQRRRCCRAHVCVSILSWSLSTCWRARSHLNSRAVSWNRPSDMAEMPSRRCRPKVDTLVPVASWTALQARRDTRALLNTWVPASAPGLRQTRVLAAETGGGARSIRDRPAKRQRSIGRQGGWDCWAKQIRRL